MCLAPKKFKEHASVLFQVSLTGQKRLPYIVGKAKKSRCFHGLTVLPVQYRSNSSAWITTSQFSVWLKECQGKLRWKRDNALLQMTHNATHFVQENFEYLTVQVCLQRQFFSQTGCHSSSLSTSLTQHGFEFIQINNEEISLNTIRIWQSADIILNWWRIGRFTW